jgi:outer membrane murein-binding lipoprotein Lpp
MKLIYHSVIIITITILFAAVIFIAGCSSTGIQRSEKATTTMKTMDSDIKLVAAQLDATGSSLDELTLSGQSDIRKAFDLYTDNVSKMEGMEKQFAKHADEMKSRGKEYFEEWQKQDGKYKNSQIQELSEQRRMELGDIYGKIAQNSIGVKEAFKAYVSDVKEIQLFLSNDLTTKGIAAIDPLSKKVVMDGESLKFAIKDVQTAIDKARSEMAQNGK